MDLRFSVRSRFFSPIERALGTPESAIKWPVRIALEPGGYNRDVEVVIRSDDTRSFRSNWAGNDPSRFSARIRAAATVLQRKGYSGRFRVTHEDGALSIRRVS